MVYCNVVLNSSCYAVLSVLYSIFLYRIVLCHIVLYRIGLHCIEVCKNLSNSSVSSDRGLSQNQIPPTATFYYFLSFLLFFLILRRDRLPIQPTDGCL